MTCRRWGTEGKNWGSGGEEKWDKMKRWLTLKANNSHHPPSVACWAVKLHNRGITPTWEFQRGESSKCFQLSLAPPPSSHYTTTPCGVSYSSTSKYSNHTHPSKETSPSQCAHQLCSTPRSEGSLKVPFVTCWYIYTYLQVMI